MNPVEIFFHDLDTEWTLPMDAPIVLQVIGSTALFLQTDYARGTKDSDVLETEQLRDDRVRSTMQDLASRGSPLHERHGLYLEIVARGLPLLPHGPEWTPLGLSLRHFDVRALAPADVVISKLIRFHGNDRADIREMVETGHVEHSHLVRRFRESIPAFCMDARCDQLPQIRARLHRVERDWFGRPPTQIPLPDWLDR